MKDNPNNRSPKEGEVSPDEGAAWSVGPGMFRSLL